MNIKMTFPVPEKDLQAGLVYSLPDGEAQDLIDQELAILADEIGDEVTTFSDKTPSFLDAPKEKKVKHGNG